MIKRIITILLIITAVGIAAVVRAKTQPEEFTTFASTPDLQITWQSNPLFMVTNMLPGDSVTKSVTVKNISSGIRPLGIRGVSTFKDPETFPEKLNLIIKENGNSIRTYTLAQFFAESAGSGFVDFVDLNPGVTATYTFMVTFDPNANNTYQNAKAVFDLILGIAFDLPAQCQRWAVNPNTRFVFGTNGRDTLVGKNYPSVLVGFGGNDTLNGNNQDDCLIGGDGNDKLHGNNKNDVLLGGNGNDDLFGGNGTDMCIEGESLKTCELPAVPTPTPKKKKK